VAYNAALGNRIRRIVARRRGISERAMFGGLAFMVHGRMFAGVLGRSLMARVGIAYHARALKRPHVRPMDFTGTTLKGYVFVGPGGITTDRQLRQWVEHCLRHARALPAKQRRTRTPARQH